MYAELEQKKCSKCGVSKEKKEFGKDKNQSGGVSYSCRDCKRISRKQYQLNNPEKTILMNRRQDLKRFGITPEDYQKIHDDQSGRCACCFQHSSAFKRRLAVDHDHETGQVRALLCDQCNPGLGYFKDSVTRLNLAIAYLCKFKK